MAPLTAAGRTAPARRRATAQAPGCPPSWRRWTAAVTAGEALGLAAAAGTAGVLHAALGEPEDLGTGLLLWLGSTAGGAVEGLALALLTWRVLHPWLPALRRRRWVGATVAVTLLGWALGSLPSTVVAGATGDADPGTGAAPPLPVLVVLAVAGGLALGALVGAAQALALRGAVARPWRWVPASAVGWTAALAVVLVGAGTAPDDLAPAVLLAWGAVTGVLAGAVVGAVTGAWLPLLQDRAPAGRTRVNRFVLGVLRSPAHRLLSGALLELDLTGVRSGRRLVLPVQYARAGPAALVVWPGRPWTKRWWRNLQRPAQVEVVLTGQRLPARAVVVPPDDPARPALREAYVRRFRHADPGPQDPLVLVEPGA